MRAQRETQTLLAATAGDVLDAALDSWSMASPQVRVRLGATMAASVVFARGRMPAIPAVLAAVGVGVLAERAYVLVHDVHLAALEVVAAAAMPGPFSDPLNPDSPAKDLPGWSGELRRHRASARGARACPRPNRAGDRNEGKDAERCSLV